MGCAARIDLQAASLLWGLCLSPCGIRPMFARLPHAELMWVVGGSQRRLGRRSVPGPPNDAYLPRNRLSDRSDLWLVAPQAYGQPHKCGVAGSTKGVQLVTQFAVCT